MKIAHLILAHKNPGQLKKLITVLSDSNSYILIHIDKKANIEDFYQLIKSDLFPNVYFCKDRIPVIWGGFTMIEATINLISLLLEINIEVDYVNLISGQDFPLKTNGEMYTFLEQHKGKNFIQHIKLPAKFSNDIGNGFERVIYWHWMDTLGPERSRRLRSIQEKLRIKRKFPKGYEPYLGSQWWTLQYECIVYLFQQCTNKNKLYRYNKHTFVPDETLFQTMIMNSPFKDTVINNNLRFVNWKGPYVSNLTPEDWERINNSNFLFARKFDITFDAEIIRYLEMKNNRMSIRKKLEQEYSLDNNLP